jgi:4-amino-4-deoxy-L-arabinose transferase-like glycosyltransferase
MMKLPPTRLRAAVEVFVLLLCMALTAAVRWHTYDEPLEMDAATYAVVARELWSGRRLYTDLWDHKPPAVHLTFAAAQAVAGPGPAHVFLLGVSAAWLTLLGLYAAAAAMAGRRVGLLAAVFWAIVSADLGLQGNQPNTEAFINTALVWAVALLVRAPLGSVSRGRAAMIGALLAAASLYKQVAAVPAAAVLVGHVLGTSHGAAERRSGAGRLAVAVVVVLAAWSAVALYFALTGRLADFWAAVVTFNRFYAGSLWGNLQEGLVFDRLLSPVLYPMLPLIAVTLLGLVGGAMTMRSRAMLLAYAIGSAGAVALPGHFHPHYYQLWLPVICLGAATSLAALQPQPMPARTWLLRAGGMLAALLLAIQLPSFGESPEEWSRQKFGERLVHNAATARILDAMLLPNETFFEWGHEAELYYYSSRRPPAGEFRCEHLLAGPRESIRTARLIADLTREQPELVLVSRVHPFPLDHPVPRWLLEHYGESDETGGGPMANDYRVLVRRAGALQQRLDNQALAAAVPP